MNIAVLLGGVGFDSQKRTIQGILDNALPKGDNVYIFTCDGWNYESRFKYEEGEYNIYQLPDFTQYEGVIINADTIHDLKVGKDLANRIQQAGVPCVSLNQKWESSVCVKLENETGIGMIVEHLVKEHGAKTIYFVSGPVDNNDAGQRLAAFKDALHQLGLECQEENILYGDYTYRSGIEAAKKYLQSGRPMPDAIMAANDEMAIGLILGLEDAGYRVPEDILVTGYDNSSVAQLNHPRLTTVRRGEYTAGEVAYKKLKKMICKERDITDEIVYGKAIFSQSCGCDKKQNYTHAELQKMYVKKSVDMDEHLRLLKSSAAEFTGLETFDDFMECSKRYIRQINPEYFYLCMCGSIENYYAELDRMAEGKERGRDASVYKDDIRIPLAYEKGKFNSYGEFHKKELLPSECKKGKKGDFYIVMPMHHQEYCFGYCVVGNYERALKDTFFFHFILNLENALETVRKQDTMKAVLVRMSHIWMYDELTEIYNRAGFRKYAVNFIEDAVKRKIPVGVLFVDIDGLKKVNDTYGHEEGDNYIKSIAQILEQNCCNGELLTRYGGDEFVILFSGYLNADIKEYIDKLQADIRNSNLLSGKEYQMDVSIGYYLETDADNINLEKIIEIADENMYAAKKAKKASREQN
ncbi:MAG: GGDEF domain-containing protein [Lachnospiraceae bacterium]|nr:GGDEF domain-containing protein [Lachnospiraceae bacterium]